MGLLSGLVDDLSAGFNFLFGGDAPPAPDKIAAPPPPPDLTDVAVRQARMAARRRALGGQGLSSTYLSGPLGDMSAPPMGASSLVGS
jgi:hypothetical protein